MTRTGVSRGIVKYLDAHGRIVLPKEIRDFLGLVRNEEGVEIFCEGTDVIMRKYEPTCCFCGNLDTHMKQFKGKKICSACFVDFIEQEGLTVSG